VVRFTDDVRLWEASQPTACPLLRWTGSSWVALVEDPCPTGKCGHPACHNYGRPFHDPERLTIIVGEEAVRLYKELLKNT